MPFNYIKDYIKDARPADFVKILEGFRYKLRAQYSKLKVAYNEKHNRDEESSSVRDDQEHGMTRLKKAGPVS